MPIHNPFQLLGLPLRFEIDDAALRRAYLTRVSAIHPDIAGDDQAQAASAELNLARELLANPESRANTLLALLGGPSKEADKSLPPTFLMEIMETREAIEAALATGDPQERARWTDWGHKQRSSHISQVAAQFGALGAAPPPAALKQIRTTLNTWRYIERLIEQLDPAHDPNQADFKN